MINVRGVSKRYKIVGPKCGLLARRRSEDFWALQDVSLTVGAGELVGIIGKNGAGKSTLLKILTRITPPTKGEAELYGRVGSLLEVGTGFHPELTGRENVYLNGCILGMRRYEIRAAFDAIVQFAGVEQFLDTPVKRYSSGMYVRLAFAVAAHLNSEILLVDEVLAVGDVEFQRKCLRKIKDVTNSGRTVLFVSHHLESVSSLCSRAIVLDGGSVCFDGAVSLAVANYMSSFAQADVDLSDFDRRGGTGEVRVIEAKTSSSSYNSRDTKVIRMRLKRMSAALGRFFISIQIMDHFGNVVVQCDSRLTEQWFEVDDELDVEFMLGTPLLRPGSYAVTICLCSFGVLDKCSHACVIEIESALPYPGVVGGEAIENGIVFGDFSYTYSRGATMVGGVV